MNNDFFNKKVLLVIGLLIFCFFGSYFITDRLTNAKYKDDGEATQVNQTYNSTKTIDLNVKIVLKEDDKVVKEEKVDQFATENSIDTDISESFLINYFTAQGYTLESLQDDQIVFVKEGQVITLEPNKYYIGEKDGYFAIYKTDSNGRAFIEEAKDVYSDKRLVDTIPDNDQQEIKTFKYYYDTKEEAKERVSSYIS